MTTYFLTFKVVVCWIQEY